MEHRYRVRENLHDSLKTNKKNIQRNLKEKEFIVIAYEAKNIIHEIKNAHELGVKAFSDIIPKCETIIQLATSADAQQTSTDEWNQQMCEKHFSTVIELLGLLEQV